ncbi:MAG: hypothetical protein AAGI52_01530 [Bacteroidota bacterium]
MLAAPSLAPVLAFLLAALFLVQPDTTDTPPVLDVPDLRPQPRLPEIPIADDSTDENRVTIRPRLAPSALYSDARGFGIGAGVNVQNLGFAGSDLSLDVRASQRLQSLSASAYTGDRYEEPVYGFVSVVASTTTRRRYFGIGPFTSEDNRLFLDYGSLDAEARLGIYPLGHTGLYVQPGARFLLDRLRDVEADQPGALERLREIDPSSVAAIEDGDVLDQTRYGVSLGLQVASDLRDWRAYPRSGTFVSAEARRFVAMDGSGLRFNRFAGNTLGYLPIRGRTALVGRATLVLTRSDDDADIPFYYLPVLDAALLTAYPPDRFVGRDVLALGGGLRFPIRDFIGVYGIDALIMGYLGNAYNNVFEEFEASITFDSAPIANDGNAPLRPALGLGLGIVNLDKERVVLGGLVGISPEGIALASLRIAYDLRDARPLFR